MASFFQPTAKNVKTSEARFEEKAAEAHSEEQPAAAEPAAEVRSKEQPAPAKPATQESEIIDATRVNDSDCLPLVVDIGDHFKANMDEQSTEEGFAQSLRSLLETEMLSPSKMSRQTWRRIHVPNN